MLNSIAGLHGAPFIASFTPTSISGCTLWLDASDTATIAVSGTAVTQWDDKSGSGNNFAQSTAANRPVSGTTTQNSKNVIVFDGTNDQLDSNRAASYWNFLHNTATTLFFAVNKTGTTAESPIVWNNGGTSSNIGYGVELRYDAENDVFQWVTIGSSGLYSVFNNTGALYTTSSFFYGSVVTDPSNATAANRSEIRFKNGTAVKNNAATNTPSASNASNILRVGGNSLTYFQGNIGEVIIYNTALNSTDRALVESYLASKWGV
jgi:hypothetical protein